MKKLSGILALALTTSALTFSTPSYSAVSLVTFNAPLALMSLGMLAGAGVAGIVGDKSYRSNNDVIASGGAFLQIGAAVIAVVGIITLDGEGGQKLAFAEITPKQAKLLGVTNEEKQIFNSELDMANQVFSQVTSELDRMEKPKAQDAKALWEQYESMLSVETVSVMKKISQSSAK